MGISLRVAADIGGTFTDIALLTPDGQLATRKVPSTPPDYANGVIRGIHELLAEIGQPLSAISDVLHGCTVATNAILEHKGARTALITTRGFRDVLEFRRIRVPHLYQPLYVKPEPLVPRRRRYEVTERMGPKGEVLTPLDEGDVLAAARRIKADGSEAVAVCLLHSYANPEHERRIGEILARELPGAFVSLSIDVLPEMREYERTSTTVINSYVGPPVRIYLQSLIDQLQGAGITGRLQVMQSSGGILEAQAVLGKPAQIVECGPAAGVIGGAYLGRLCGFENVITFDMGGTTAKASMIQKGEIVTSDEYEVGGGIATSSVLVQGGGYALKVPAIDISEVGAGGGSVVWLDRAGAIKVGPQSAGAVPGPACYDAGGTEPTVTDANVVLGYLNPEALAGGTVPIKAALARRAIEDRIAGPLRRDPVETAFGIHTIANANMMRAVKAVTTYRGRDPRDFVLLAFGGNGGVHAAELARQLRVQRIIVPPAAGVFSALGLLFANVELTQSTACLRFTRDLVPGEIESSYRALEARVAREMGYDTRRVAFLRYMDVRYAGQAFELKVAVPNGELTREAIAQVEERFEAEHEQTYGHRFSGEYPFEVVNLRVVGSVDPGRTQLAARADTGGAMPPERTRPVYFGPAFGSRDTLVIGRGGLSETPRAGPLVIEEYEGTTVVPPDAHATRDVFGNIVITLAKVE